jgi:hypothetical protein
MHYTGGTWTGVDPANMRGHSAYDIDMVAANSGWLSQGFRAFQYDGTSWTLRSNGLANLYLGRISALAANDVWGVGYDYDNGRGTILHWNGTQWSTTGPVLTDTINLYDIEMVSPTEGWVVGYNFNSTISDYEPVILRYDGTNWTSVASPFPNGFLFRLSAPTPGEVWVTGQNNTNFKVGVYRYNGTWTSYPDVGGDNVFMLSASEGWATNYGFIYHWDGTDWTFEDYADFYVSGLSGASGQAWAVGAADTILTRSSSGTWSKQHGGPTTNALYAASAVSPDEMWAVGSNGIILRYSGGTWQQVPGGSNTYLSDIQMLSSTEGYAVGGDFSDNGEIIRWDGTVWKTVAIPDEPMNGVYMLGGGNGWAVGQDGAIWRATSGAWKGASSPVTVTLNSVAMDSPTHGWAVGSDYDFSTDTYRNALLEYNGTAWIDRTSTLPAGSPNLQDVALAPGGNSGWAVGYADTGTGGQYGVLRLNNGVWSVDTTSPLFGDFSEVILDSGSKAWAIGGGVYRYTGSTWQYESLPSDSYSVNGGAFVPGVRGWLVGYGGLILQYDEPNNLTPTPSITGTPPTATATSQPNCAPVWRTVASPNVGTNSNELRAVEAISSTEAWAVGYYRNDQFSERTLIERWDGTNWNIVATPNITATGARLQDITAVAPNNVWAAGTWAGGSLIVHWDGTNWSMVPVPNTGTGFNNLAAIDAIAADDIWAVGVTGTNTGAAPLLMHWNGTSWSIVSSPDPLGAFSELYGLGAVGPDDVWAVGYYNQGSDKYNLILHWNGTTWSVVSSPNVPNAANALYDVASVAPNDVWAVGELNYGGSGQIEHWDGTEWSIVPATVPGALRSVAVVDANNVWAAGDRNGESQTLTMRWNGASWNFVPSASPNPEGNSFKGIAAESGGYLWAVGKQGPFDPGQTLIERYKSICPATATPTLTPTATNTAIPTNTAMPTATTVACSITFSDVPVTNTFYQFVRCLACRNILGGYSDNTFRPNNEVTRGQLSKIVANSANFNEPVTGQTFEDVSPSDTFYQYIERMASRGIIGGYPCGGVSEPCGSGKPYFRPNANATRGQISKIVSNSANFTDPPGSQKFADVAPGSTFYDWVNRLANKGIMGGYNCGGAGEPCGPGNLPYFRPGNNATRGQTSKIVAGAFFPTCQAESAP